MASTITAGNATNGAAIASDNTGILQLKTGTGSGTTALTLDASQNATLAGTLQVASVTTNMYPLVSGTAQSATSGTNVDFTGIPSWAKRVTVVMNDVSLSGSSATLMVRLGTASGIEASAIYFSGGGAITTGSVASGFNYTTGFGLVSSTATNTFCGQIIITNITGNTWVMSGTGINNTTTVCYFAGRVTLTGALTQLRCTNNGSETFDAGTINILYE